MDVGHSIALYAEFSRSGGNYIPFPDPAHYRISLDDWPIRGTRLAAWGLARPVEPRSVAAQRAGDGAKSPTGSRGWRSR